MIHVCDISQPFCKGQSETATTSDEEHLGICYELTTVGEELSNHYAGSDSWALAEACVKRRQSEKRDAGSQAAIWV